MARPADGEQEAGGGGEPGKEAAGAAADTEASPWQGSCQPLPGGAAAGPGTGSAALCGPDFDPYDPHWSSFSIVGTDVYMAPEVLLRRGHTVAADWWSLGIFATEMLQGRHPFMVLPGRDTGATKEAEAAEAAEVAAETARARAAAEEAAAEYCQAMAAALTAAEAVAAADEAGQDGAETKALLRATTKAATRAKTRKVAKEELLQRTEAKAEAKAKAKAKAKARARTRARGPTRRLDL